MSRFKSCLKAETKMFIESLRLAVSFTHQSGNALHIRLLKRIVETRPQILARHPLPRAVAGDVHVHIDAVEFVEHDTSDKLATALPTNAHGTAEVAKLVRALGDPLDHGLTDDYQTNPPSS